MNQRPLDLLLSAAVILVGTARLAGAQETPKPSGDQGQEKRYQICLWPNPCGSTGKPRPAPTGPKKEEKPKAVPVPNAELDSLRLYVNPDPLSQTILRGKVTSQDDGVVSAVRLKSSESGWKEDQILYRGDGSDLRDALASGSAGLGLPSSRIGAGQRARNGSSDDEWVKIEKAGVSSGQANGMRAERTALTGDASQSREGLSRMWGGSASESRP